MNDTPTFTIPLEGQAAGVEMDAYFYPATETRRGVLQVLVHGNSYDHRYWDVGTIGGRNYSYVRYMTERGFDIVALDLPGAEGRRDFDGHAITVDLVGRALSGAIERFRQGGVSGLRFEQVVSIGHSMGSSIGVYAEARWPAADHLLVTATGYLPHRPRSAWAPGVREALLEPAFAWVPAEGRAKFYHMPSASTEVMQHDNEVLRSAIASGIWSDCIELSEDLERSGVGDVRCPVFVQLGEFDPILPARFADEEQGCYRSASSVVAHPLANIGHSFNLHRNALDSWKGILAYLDSTR